MVNRVLTVIAGLAVALLAGCNTVPREQGASAAGKTNKPQLCRFDRAYCETYLLGDRAPQLDPHQP